jgi:hypothetical protein
MVPFGIIIDDYVRNNKLRDAVELSEMSKGGKFEINKENMKSLHLPKKARIIYLLYGYKTLSLVEVKRDGSVELLKTLNEEEKKRLEHLHESFMGMEARSLKSGHAEFHLEPKEDSLLNGKEHRPLRKEKVDEFYNLLFEFKKNLINEEEIIIFIPSRKFIYFPYHFLFLDKGKKTMIFQYPSLFIFRSFQAQRPFIPEGYKVVNLMPTDDKWKCLTKENMKKYVVEFLGIREETNSRNIFFIAHGKAGFRGENAELFYGDGSDIKSLRDFFKSHRVEVFISASCWLGYTSVRDIDMCTGMYRLLVEKNVRFSITSLWGWSPRSIASAVFFHFFEYMRRGCPPYLAYWEAVKDARKKTSADQKLDDVFTPICDSCKACEIPSMPEDDFSSPHFWANLIYIGGIRNFSVWQKFIKFFRTLWNKLRGFALSNKSSILGRRH